MSAQQLRALKAELHIVRAAALRSLMSADRIGFASTTIRPGTALLDTYWYTVIYPGGAILFFVLGWNLLGDAFRDVLDPRLRGMKS